MDTHKYGNGSTLHTFGGHGTTVASVLTGKHHAVAVHTPDLPMFTPKPMGTPRFPLTHFLGKSYR